MENITVSDPFYLNDGHDHAATVMVSTVVFTLIMILTLVAKNLLRWNTGAGWYNFDNPLHCGAVMSLAQAICTGVAVNAGLGKQKEYINSAAEENKILQLQYAAAMLALLAVTSTKIALCLLIEHINNYGRVKTAIRMFMCFLILESVIGLLAHAFRCSLPTPWRASSPLACAAAQHIYLYNGVMDIITDVMLFILSIAMIWDVKTNTKRKSIVIALFATRILYVVLFTSRAPSFQNSTLPATRRATALILSERFSCPFCRVGTLLRTDFLYESNNFTWEAVVPTVWQQMSCNLSVITACVPSMKTIFDSLSGNVASAGIDAPYNLIAIRGATGFKATALESNTTKRASHVSSYVKRGGLKLGSDSPNEVSCYSGRRMLDLSSRSKDKEGDGTSESVRNLTGGVVVITEEVKVDYESADGQGSCVGSTRSASTAY